MNPCLKRVVESKCEFRRNLAARPVAEKLRMLDVLRERELAIRGRTSRLDGVVGKEKKNLNIQ